LAAKILCVDDDRNFCRILSRAFSSEGYGVEMAHDGEAALAKVRACSPDLVVLDILLPRRDGFEVLEAIRKEEGRLAQTPVMLLSGCTITPAYQARADRLHADAALKKPVPLKVILELVAKQIGAGAPSTPIRTRLGAEPRKKEREPIALSGSFEEVPFASLLHHLHGLRASGVLQLQSGKKKKLLQIEEGHPVAVRSNLVDECLGNLLLATGKITSDVLHESIQRMNRGEGPQGQILVAMHMLDEQDLAMALRNQAEEKLFEIFTWRTGSFHFTQGVRLRDANALFLKSSPANLVMDGVSFRLPMEEVDRFLGERAHRYPIRGESPFYRFQDIRLDTDEEALLNGLDASRQLGDLLDRDETTRRALYALITLELIELRESSPRTRRALRRGRVTEPPGAASAGGEALGAPRAARGHRRSRRRGTPRRARGDGGEAAGPRLLRDPRRSRRRRGGRDPRSLRGSRQAHPPGPLRWRQ